MRLPLILFGNYWKCEGFSDMNFSLGSSILHPLKADCLANAPNIFIKRDDLIHPIVSGNKWRKLEFAIAKAISENKNHLVTFGGAFSNHMVATACTGATLGIRTSCFVRGDELEGTPNHYLFTAKLYGMELIPVSREAYRDKFALFLQHFGANKIAYFVAEGGESEEGILGVEKIITELDLTPDYIVHASATATTACGLARGIHKLNSEANTTKVLSIAILKNKAEQTSKIEALGLQHICEIVEGYECGGYAKTNEELIHFCKNFIRQTGIMIDPVYTGKALFALANLLQNGTLTNDKKIVFLHTGGTLGIFSDKFRNAMG